MPDFNAGNGMNLGAQADKIRTYEINDDGDIAQLAILMRNFAQGCGAVIDEGADRIFAALWGYDRGKRGPMGRTRAKSVVMPMRHFAAGMRLAHRFMMRAVANYRRLYADDIAAETAAKQKTAFKPGRR